MGTLVNLFILISAALAAVTALFTRPVKAHASPPMVALMVGILAGWALPWPVSHIHLRNFLVGEAARLTLAMALMSAALRISKSGLRRQWKAGAIMIGLLMPMMWIASTLVVKLVLSLSWLKSFLIGAIVTPSDPAVAASIISGRRAEKHAPESLRTLVSLESGANDGLSYLLVFIPLLLLKHSPLDAAKQLMTTMLLQQVLGGAAFGLLAGYSAGRVASWAAAREQSGRESILLFSAALALAVMTGGELLGLNAVLAVFAAGMAFNFTQPEDSPAASEQVQSAFDLMVTVPTFVLIGIALPWSQWIQMGWKAIGFVAALFLFRRLPAMFALGPLLRRWHNSAARIILGWAGPIGTAAVFYAILSLQMVGWRGAWTYGSLAVASSVLLHGATAPQIVAHFGTQGAYRELYESESEAEMQGTADRNQESGIGRL